MEKKVVNILEKYNQTHILNYINLLKQEEIKNLEKQILKIDFEELQTLYEKTKEKPEIRENKIEHINYINKEKLSTKKKQELEDIGSNVIKNEHYAVITLAGGQGTRLGHSGPKGTYMLNTKNGQKYIFEIFIDSFKKAKTEYNIEVPWYIMTSKENHKETVEFFENHNYFGYNKNKVKFFMQGELPILDTNGKVILNKEKQIKEAANGNGGIYESFAKSGLLEEIKQKQIEWIFVNNIDNIISNFIDPLLLGLTIQEKQKIGAKSVAKTNPKEKVGVFCKIDEKPQIIEYIDLPEKLAEKKDENGELLYGEVNIGAYLFNISVLEDLARIKLPYHAAFKKSAYLLENGEYIEPESPNVYKFESFIFDAFKRYNNVSILRVKREEEFAPVKNKEGTDSPETAIKLYNAKL